MPKIQYSVSRMLCHIMIGFIGGTIFLTSASNSHTVKAQGNPGANAQAEHRPILTSWPLSKP